MKDLQIYLSSDDILTTEQSLEIKGGGGNSNHSIIIADMDAV